MDDSEKVFEKFKPKLGFIKRTGETLLITSDDGELTIGIVGENARKFGTINYLTSP